jgi:hypothetical protein
MPSCPAEEIADLEACWSLPTYYRPEPDAFAPDWLWLLYAIAFIVINVLVVLG